MIRIILLFVLFIVVARVFWRIVDNIVEGATGRPLRGSSQAPRGVQMARDPVCGTFVVPHGSLSIADGRTTVYFCSEACREKFLASNRRASAKDRTA